MKDGGMIMKKGNKRAIVAVLVALATLSTATASKANFADDWLQGVQSNQTNASFSKGAQRGYFTGGGFSARWPMTNDNLMTITPPSIKAGCGGIDVFFGGFNMLNPDYLVKKLQRILAAAPAAAFDIALKTLAPQVSDTIKSLEAMIDKLNHLSLDDCKAAKALVAMAPNPFSGAASDAFNAQATAAKSDFLTSSGIDQSWSENLTNLKNSVLGGGPSGTAKQAADASIANCPPALQTIFGGGSVLSAIGTMQGLPDTHIQSIRGFIGDVYVVTPSDNGGDWDAIYNFPCGNNTFQSLIDGTAMISNDQGTCSNAPDINGNLFAYSTQQMVSIVNSIQNNSAVLPAATAFMNMVPMPIYPALRAAVRTGTTDSMIAKLSDIVSKGLAYQMMQDMAMRVYQLDAHLKHIKSTQKTAPNGSDPASTGCQLTVFDKPMQYMDQVVAKMQSRMDEAYQDYAAAAANSAAIETITAALKKFDDISRQQLAAQFSKGAASRALSKG
jgi:conjugative transfer pilus assembly protein TraH